MKKRVIRMMLGGLAFLPIGSVALAAESRLAELDGEVRADELREDLLRARRKLFERNQFRTTVDDAYRRFSEGFGQGTPEGIQAEFEATVLLLHENGLLTFDEKEMLSGAPSEFP